MRRCRIGSANAAVLPVPVAAWPRRSLPSISGGIVSCWIGRGLLVAEGGERRDDLVVEAEGGEAGVLGGGFGHPTVYGLRHTR